MDRLFFVQWGRKVFSETRCNTTDMKKERTL